MVLQIIHEIFYESHSIFPSRAWAIKKKMQEMSEMSVSIILFHYIFLVIQFLNGAQQNKKLK